MEETLQGHVVDIACIRRYRNAQMVQRAQQHTTECALMGHCIESGCAVVDEAGAVHLLDTHATRQVVDVLEAAEADVGARLRVERAERDGEMRTRHVELDTGG